MRASSLLVFALPLVSGCAAAVYTPSGTVNAPPRPANCEFAMLTALPDQPLEQLGILDVTQGSGLVTTAAKFRKLVAPQVCAAGGEVVVAEVNGYGQYVRGSVFRRKGEPAAAEAAPTGTKSL